MKRKIAIICFMLIVSCFNASLPFYPRTNLMISGFNIDDDVLNGISVLENKFSEDELIFLNVTDIINLAVNLNVDFTSLNGRILTKQKHHRVSSGHPVIGEMSFLKFAMSPFYIDQLDYIKPDINGEGEHSISFTLKDALDEQTFPNIYITFIVLTKDITDVSYLAGAVNFLPKNFPVYIKSINSSIITDGEDQDFSQDIILEYLANLLGVPAITGNDLGELTNNFKALIIISDSDLNYNNIFYDDHDFICYQAASSERTIPPFRVVTKENLSVIDEPADSMYPVFFGKFYVLNTDFNEVATKEVKINIEGDFNPFNLDSQFCQEGLCVGNSYTIELENGSCYNYLYGQVSPDSNFPSFAKLKFNIQYPPNAPTHIEVLPLYYSSKYVDILLINDSGYDDSDEDFCEILYNLHNFSVGIFNPYFGELKEENLEYIDTIIWNVPSVYPKIKAEELALFSSKKLIVAGQDLSNVLSNQDYSSYYNQTSIDFFNDFLKSELVEGTQIANNVEGKGFMNDLNFTLTGNFSKNYLNPLSDSEILFEDNFGNTKGISDQNFIYLDFDIDSIDNYQEKSTLLNYLIWQGTDDSDQNIMIKPNSLNIYPNPVASEINIKYSGLTKSIPKFAIYNIKGQNVYSGVLNKNNDTFETNINMKSLNLSSGIYFIKILDTPEQKVKKFLILK